MGQTPFVRAGLNVLDLWFKVWGWVVPSAHAAHCFCSVAVKCSVCKSVSDTYDPYLDIALEIRVRLGSGLCSWGQHEREGVGLSSENL